MLDNYFVLKYLFLEDLEITVFWYSSFKVWHFQAKPHFKEKAIHLPVEISKTKTFHIIPSLNHVINVFLGGAHSSQEMHCPGS